MNHTDHVNLLRGGIATPDGVWADLGSGGGAFTLALADLLGPQARIFSVDKQASALQEQARSMRTRFPETQVTYVNADFTSPLELPLLDGIVMANSLHFVRQKEPLLQRLRDYLRPEGRLLLVEYNADRGNWWVPHPLSYPTWAALANRCGFAGAGGTRLLERRPSRFLDEIYSALSVKA